MKKEELNKVCKKLSDPPKGILAADESTNTIKKRFDQIGVESNFENRRKYRELLFKTESLSNFISGVILYEETLRQKTSDNVLFPKFLMDNGIAPGIKVDTGAIPILSDTSEKITQGLDGLSDRLQEYSDLGAIFTKWRAIIDIDKDKNIPSDYSIDCNAFILGRYARIVQESGMVPIVEPEVIMDGKHTIHDCYEITSKTLKKVFEQLSMHKVYLGGILLKPNMVISGSNCPEQASVNEVASMTLKCLKENVPEEVPGIVFLSGGQSNELATNHLNEMNKIKNNSSWNLSFSYGRALQQPSLNLWKGREEKIVDSQLALIKRSKHNSNATIGSYSTDHEDA